MKSLFKGQNFYHNKYDANCIWGTIKTTYEGEPLQIDVLKIDSDLIKLKEGDFEVDEISNDIIVHITSYFEPDEKKLRRKIIYRAKKALGKYIEEAECAECMGSIYDDLVKENEINRTIDEDNERQRRNPQRSS